MVKAPCSHCRGHGLDPWPWLGMISHTSQYSQKNKRKNQLGAWVCVCVWEREREKQRKIYYRTWCTWLWRPSVNWRIREAGITQPWSKGLRACRAPKDRGKCISQPRQRERACPPSTFLLSLDPQWTGWCPLTVVRVTYSLLFSLPMSSRNTLTDILRNNVLPAIWASLSPSSWQ